MDNYVVKRSERPFLEEVAWSRLPCPIHSNFWISVGFYLLNRKVIGIAMIWCNLSAISIFRKSSNYAYLLCGKQKTPSVMECYQKRQKIFKVQFRRLHLTLQDFLGTISYSIVLLHKMMPRHFSRPGFSFRLPRRQSPFDRLVLFTPTAKHVCG